MGRQFGSRDSFKRNSVNYKGRLRGATSDDTYGYWLRNQRDRGLVKPTGTAEHLRIRYLWEYLGLTRPFSKRYRFSVKRVISLWKALPDCLDWMRLYLPEGKRDCKGNYRPTTISEEEAQAILLFNRILIQRRKSMFMELGNLEKDRK